MFLQEREAEAAEQLAAEALAKRSLSVAARAASDAQHFDPSEQDTDTEDQV